MNIFTHLVAKAIIGLALIATLAACDAKPNNSVPQVNTSSLPLTVYNILALHRDGSMLVLCRHYTLYATILTR